MHGIYFTKFNIFFDDAFANSASIFLDLSLTLLLGPSTPSFRRYKNALRCRLRSAETQIRSKIIVDVTRASKNFECGKSIISVYRDPIFAKSTCENSDEMYSFAGHSKRSSRHKASSSYLYGNK